MLTVLYGSVGVYGLGFRVEIWASRFYWVRKRFCLDFKRDIWMIGGVAQVPLHRAFVFFNNGHFEECSWRVQAAFRVCKGSRGAYIQASGVLRF